jgi:predicted nucleic acid-binding protein
MAKTFQDIPHLAEVMIDANILIYALLPQAPQYLSCQGLLERGARDEVHLNLTVSVAAEVIHRVMVLEANALGVAKRPAHIVSYLKKHPEQVQ